MAPKNRTDYVTMLHDLDYMEAQSPVDALFADYRAIVNSDYDLPGIATKIGLLTRSIVAPNSFYGGDASQARLAKELLKTDPFWIVQTKLYA